MTNHPLNETYTLFRRGCRSLFTLFALLGLPLKSRHFLGFEIVSVGSSKTFEEVVEGANTWKIARPEAAEDGIVRNTLHFTNPLGNAYFWFCHKKKKMGTEHGSWITRFRTFGGIVS